MTEIALRSITRAHEGVREKWEQKVVIFDRYCYHGSNQVVTAPMNERQ